MKVAFIITLLGLFLRLVLLNQSFWLDEGASFQIASNSVHQIVTSTSDFHPPLFYLLLHGWLSVVNHAPEWVIRIPFVLLSTLSIYLLFVLNRTIFGSKNKLLLYVPSVLLAINPFHIYYSQELRMYSLNTTLTLLTWVYLIKLDKKETFTNKTLFILFTTLNLYTFYGAFFNLFAQISYWIFSKKSLKNISYILFIIFLFFAPWLPYLIKQMQGSGVLSNLAGWKEISGMLTLKDLFLIPTKFLLSRISIVPKSLYYIISGVVIAVSSLFIFRSRSNKQSTIFLFYFFTPLLIASVISLKTPVLGYWRYLFVTPALCTLLTLGIANSKPKIRSVGIIFFLLLFISANLYFWANPKFHREDWQSLSQQIKKEDSLVIFNFTGPFAPLSYYLPIANFFSTQTHLGQTNQDKVRELESVINNYSHIYYLDYLSDLTDPGRNTLKQLENSNLKQVQKTSINGIGLLVEFDVVK